MLTPPLDRVDNNSSPQACMGAGGRPAGPARGTVRSDLLSLSLSLSHSLSLSLSLSLTTLTHSLTHTFSSMRQSQVKRKLAALQLIRSKKKPKKETPPPPPQKSRTYSTEYRIYRPGLTLQPLLEGHFPPRTIVVLRATFTRDACRPCRDGNGERSVPRQIQHARPYGITSGWVSPSTPLLFPEQ
ncbi:hypothetical protein LZ30DRAFT_366122 [Colletotrichum cereale]|nr:hypothetical protein LZ30DRAFT_366122 [Colletotrichum cereale]